MKLSRAAGYALHARTHIARQPAERAERAERFVSSHAAAGAAGAPAAFLRHVLLRLASAGLVRSVKGRRGGYSLARPPGDITLLEVVEAVGGLLRGSVPAVSAAAADGLDGRLGTVCQGAAQVVREWLGLVRLSDVMNR
jgi:Rrf2 family protein